MPIVNGYWMPTLSDKQAQIVNCRKRFLLVSGPKKSGKTIGCTHALVRHAVETDRGRIAIFARTTKLATDGGVWQDLIGLSIPEWINGDTGLKWVTPPKIDGSTRQHYTEISNRVGNKTRFVLNSLDFDGNIEEVIRGKRYSMIYFNEFSNFRSRHVFDIAIDQLRCVHLPFEAHQFMADTNPSDEGEESWIYKLWWGERSMENHPDVAFRNDLEVIEVMIEDNPFLNDRERDSLIATFRHDPDVYNRYIKGIWTTSSADSHFSDVFRPELHIVGDTSSIYEAEWEILLPEDNCQDLITGWDIGSINHAIHIIEPATIEGRIVFKVLDEIVLIGQKLGLGDVTQMVMDRMDYWEGVIGRPVNWRHWSDKSAFDSFRPIAELYDYAFISKFSDGRIDLRAAPKFNNSVPKRVDTLRRLLFEDRLLVSAKCLKTIAMFRGLKKGDKRSNYLDRISPLKHPFDSLSYPLLSESPHDLEAGVGPKVGRMVTMT